MFSIIHYGGQTQASRGQWYMRASEWWVDLPTNPTRLTFTLKQRLFGPMRSHVGKQLTLMGRLLYDWFFTDDPYFDRVDQELKQKGL